jgi:hypothetical protein
MKYMSRHVLRKKKTRDETRKSISIGHQDKA